MRNEWNQPPRHTKLYWTRPGVSFGKRILLLFETLLCFTKIFAYYSLLNKCVSIAWVILFCSLGLLLEPLIEKEGSIDRKFTLSYGRRDSSFSAWSTIEKGKRLSVQPTPEYIYGEFYQGLAKAQGAENTLLGIIKPSGEWLVTPKFDDVGSFRDGIAPILIKGRAGFVDLAGKVTMVKIPQPPKAYVHSKRTCKTYPHDMSLPLYLGKNYMILYNEKEGMVDSLGNWLIQPLYSFEEFEQHEFIVGAALLEDELSYEPDWKYFKISNGSKYGVADLDGKIVLQPRYDDISSFNKGRAAVKIAEHFGFVDSSGKIVIKPKYDQVTPFDDLIGVECEGKWSLINSRGAPVRCPKFDGVVLEPGYQWFSNGLAGVQVNKMCGFIDAKGTLKIAPTYKFVKPFDHGSAAVWDGSFWQFIDTNGKIISPIKFASISSFKDNKAFVTVPGPLYKLFE